MKNIELHSHRFALQIIESVPELKALWLEILETIESISDDDLIREFNRINSGSPSATNLEQDDEFEEGSKKGKMSLSHAINSLLDKRLASKGWTSQSALFQGREYSTGTRWRLDFSKRVELQDAMEGSSESFKESGMAIEVAFNHGEAIAWNLLKPVIAGELNHVEKETTIGAGIGVVITATEALKKAGAFDNAVGEYEKFLRYLKPMRTQLTVPMVIVGLPAPESFKVVKRKNPATRRNEGIVVNIESPTASH